MKKTVSILLIVALAVLQCAALAYAFSDVDSTHDWAKEAIESFTERGIIQGRGDGIFAPDDHVTREEFAKALALTFGLDLEGDGKTVYADVGQGSWSVPYINAADDYVVPIWEIDPQEGMYSVVRYRPQRPATRFEIAVAVVKAMGYQGEGNATAKFSDMAEVPEKYAPYIAYAAQHQIVEGYPDDTFRPFDNVTRAEAVVLLYRAYNMLNKPSETPAPSKEPDSSPTVSPSETPTASASPSVSPSETPWPTAPNGGLPMPPKDNHVAVLKSMSQVSLDGEIATKFEVCFNGETEVVPLYSDEDIKVMGVKSTVEGLKPGDVFLYGYYYTTGRISHIYVLFSTEYAGQYDGEIYTDLLDLPKGTRYGDYGLYDSGNKINLYYGKLIKATNGKDGRLLELQGSPDNSRIVYVPDNLPVLHITMFANAANARFSTMSAQDLYGGGNGTYVFVRIRDHITIDAVAIDFK